MKYHKRPVEIEAELFEGTEKSATKILTFIDDKNLGSVFAVPHKETGEWIVIIETLEGVMSASPGDYIIKGVQGEFYPCKPDIFESTYDPV